MYQVLQRKIFKSMPFLCQTISCEERSFYFYNHQELQTVNSFDISLQVKIWFQNKRYKCKKQSQESRRGIHPPPYEWPSLFQHQHQRQVPVLVQPPSCPPHCYRPPPSVNLNSPLPDSYTGGYFPESYSTATPHYNNNVYSSSPYNQWPCYK